MTEIKGNHVALVGKVGLAQMFVLPTVKNSTGCTDATHPPNGDTVVCDGEGRAPTQMESRAVRAKQSHPTGSYSDLCRRETSRTEMDSKATALFASESGGMAGYCVRRAFLTHACYE